MIIDNITNIEEIFQLGYDGYFRYEDEKRIVNFVLFTRTEILKDERYVSIRVNEEFKYILNELTGNFTKFELSQFVKLNSHYSKNLFRLLKQFSSTGWREFLLSDFRNLLDIPEKYRISEIDKYVLNEKNIKELSESFTNLKIIKKYNGRLVHKIKFEWKKTPVLGKTKIIYTSDKVEAKRITISQLIKIFNPKEIDFQVNDSLKYYRYNFTIENLNNHKIELKQVKKFLINHNLIENVENK